MGDKYCTIPYNIILHGTLLCMVRSKIIIRKGKELMGLQRSRNTYYANMYIVYLAFDLLHIM